MYDSPTCQDQLCFPNVLRLAISYPESSLPVYFFSVLHLTIVNILKHFYFYIFMYRYDTFSIFLYLYVWVWTCVTVTRVQKAIRCLMSIASQPVGWWPFNNPPSQQKKCTLWFITAASQLWTSNKNNVMVWVAKWTILKGHRIGKVENHLLP